MTVDAALKFQEHAQMVAARQPHESVWRDCFKWTHPIRGMGFISDEINATTAQAYQAEQTDSTAPDAADICAAEVHSGMTPANSRWFGMAVSGADDEGNRWLDGAATTLWENIHMANFDAAGFECSQDAVDAGWFVLFVDEDREQGGFMFEQWPIHQCFGASSKRGGMVDIVHRRYKLTALQVVNEFGEANVSADVRKLIEDGKGHELVDLLHIIEPRRLYVQNAKLSKNLPISSCTFEYKNKKILRESGFHEMPVMFPRWLMIPGSVYAVGPVNKVLPTIKRLNRLTRLEMAAGEIAVSGMWIAEDDGVLNPRTIKVGGGRVIVANSVDSMKALQTGSNFVLSADLVDRMQAQIRRALLADAIPPVDAGQRTAYEYSVRINMLRKLLGPVFGRLQSEYLGPLITRCFGIAYRAGIFTPPPESLANQNFTVKYIGPLARAQKLEEATAIEEFVIATLKLSETKPELADNVDFDEAARLTAEAKGVPGKVVRSKDDVKKIRDARVQAEQEAQQQAMQQQLAMNAGDAMIKKAANQ